MWTRTDAMALASHGGEYWIEQFEQSVLILCYRDTCSAVRPGN